MSPVLEIDHLVTRFPGPKAGSFVHACDDVSFSVGRGEVIGLVGESGCGKSTLGRTIVGLEKITSGRVLYNGMNLAHLRGQQLRLARRRIQYIFQDAYASLNPRQTISQTLEEALIVAGETNSPIRLKAIESLLSEVGLTSDIALRFPRELSGGQRQRVSIARALVMKPEVLICDEPVSALDISIRAQVMNLLLKLSREHGVACIFIAHDLSLVRQAAQRIMVMYLGRIVEVARSDDLYKCPKHPYTKALLSAIPNPDPQIERRRAPILLTGELPSPINLPHGCRFHTRCWMASSKCQAEAPMLIDIDTNDRASACFLWRQV